MPNLVDDNGTWILQPDADLADLDGELVDLTDGSWSFIDVGSQVKTVSFFGGENKAVLNDISAGNETQFSQNAYQGARWYKFLKDEKGVQVNSDERFIFIATIQALSSSSPAAFGFAIGTATNPLGTGSVGTSRQNFQHIALVNELQGSVGRKHEYDRILKFTGGGIVANHLTSSIVQLVHNFGSDRSGGVAITSNINNAQTTSGQNTSGTNPLYIQVALGTRFNSVSATDGAEHKAKMTFTVIRLDH